MSSDIPAADVAAAVDVIFQYQFFRLLVVHALRRVKQKEILCNILIFIKQIPQEDWNEYGYCDVITSGDHVRGTSKISLGPTLSLTHTQTYNQRVAITKEGEVSQSEPAWAGPLLHRSNHPTLPETPHRDSHLFAFREDRNRTGPPPHPNSHPLTPPAPTPFISFLSFSQSRDQAWMGHPRTP